MPSQKLHPLSAHTGFTRSDTVAVIALSLVVVAILLALCSPNIPSSHQRALARRVGCAANLQTLGTGMSTYASDNAGSWPIAAHAPATEDGKCTVAHAPGKIGTHRGDARDPKAGETTTNDTEMSVTRNLWTLIRLRISSPKSFQCPASPDQFNNDDKPRYFWDFAKYNEVSYGMQVPYGKHGRPGKACSPRMALAADKGPFGAALEAGARNPGPPTLTGSAEPKAWKPWNSPNHEGESQNVLYVDAHFECLRTPILPYTNDNIYTRWSNDSDGSKDGLSSLRCGAPPASNEAPFGDTDSLIYP